MYFYKIIISNSKRSQNYIKSFINKIPSNWVKNEKNFDFLFVIGGDGTLFSSAKYFINKKCKVILINGGNLGFFSSFDETNIDTIFSKILSEEKYINPQLIKLLVNKKNYYAINDIYFSSFASTPINVFINNKHYEKFKGTGFVFSTPLGSSARNKSSGGAVIIDNIDCYQMTEIQPVRQIHFNTLAAPVILSGESRVNLEILQNNIKYYCLVDGIKIKENNFSALEIIFTKAIFQLYNPNNQRIEKIRKAFISGE